MDAETKKWVLDTEDYLLHQCAMGIKWTPQEMAAAKRCVRIRETNNWAGDEWGEIVKQPEAAPVDPNPW